MIFGTPEAVVSKVSCPRAPRENRLWIMNWQATSFVIFMPLWII